MLLAHTQTIDIEHILKNELLIAHLQPVASLYTGGLFGVESLIRATLDDGKLIPPSLLFKEAARKHLTVELDKISRVCAIRAFEPLYKLNNNLILFVNIEATLIDNFELGNHLFFGEIKKLGIPYKNIVLEVKEDKISDTSKLKLFCDHYKERGFNVALDDFGVGHSSFDRIAIVHPDIIKIDRSLITNISHNHIKQQIVSAICTMCNNIGILPLAEGVETLEEAVCCTKLGASLMQGFYIAEPSTIITENNVIKKILAIQKTYSNILEKEALDEKNFFEIGKEIENRFCYLATNLKNIKNWSEVGIEILKEYPNIEAIYLIDNNNKQIGNTLLKNKPKPLYEPTKDGHNYSLKEYYVKAKNNLNRKYVTKPYISFATGNVCRTYVSITSILQTPCALCIDFLIDS